MISLIGSGNVAHWVALRLADSKDFPIGQVYSRTLGNARALAERVGAQAIDDLSQLRRDCDIYLFTVADDVYGEVLEQVPFTMPLALHTAGSVSQDVFKAHAAEYGVLYPLQTFSKKADMSRLEVPLCLEDEHIGDSRGEVARFASALSGDCRRVDGAQRAVLHLAAVFACNFVNHCCTLSADVLAPSGLDFEVMQPLLEETVAKLKEMSPRQAQTGPAIRWDTSVITRHLDMLQSSPMSQQIYKLMSQSIHDQL